MRVWDECSAHAKTRVSNRAAAYYTCFCLIMKDFALSVSHRAAAYYTCFCLIMKDFALSVSPALTAVSMQNPGLTARPGLDFMWKRNYARCPGFMRFRRIPATPLLPFPFLFSAPSDTAARHTRPRPVRLPRSGRLPPAYPISARRSCRSQGSGC